MEISRQILPDLKEFLALFPVTGIIGPRQVGKTTLAKLVSKDSHSLYIDLENPTERAQLNDPIFFLSQFEDRCVILDEIQFMPALFTSLRSLVDTKRKPGRFIVLGSATPEIIQNSAETLAGRIGYISLSPFLLREVNEIEKLWLRGGFPLSYLSATDNTSAIWRQQFIITYIQRDLGMLGLQTDVQTIDVFWRMLANAQGNLLNAESFARALGTSRTTVMKYLHFLDGAFMIRLLRAWFSNINKRLVKSPKVYVRDSGLLHSLLGLHAEESLLTNVHVGASWEGFVIEQIINALPFDIQAWFYRTQQGAECDLLLERNGNIIAAIEIKRSAHPTISKGFRISMEDTGAKAGYIIGNGKETFKVAPAIFITNIADFLNTILPEMMKKNR
jgi:uncharacterized protein